MNNKKEDEDFESFLKFFHRNLNGLNNNNSINNFFLQNILSFGLIGTLIHGYPYIPFSGGSLKPFSINHILNDILINNRENIIEFGSGISTIVIGRLIKKNNLNSILFSIEHDLQWFTQQSKLLVNENLDDVVKVCYAPLKECPIALDKNLWYDIDKVDSFVYGRNFDMVIVDGPPAWMESKNRSRFPALPYMINKLNNNYSVYLDDAMREGEKDIIRLWEEKFLFKFNYSGNSIAYYYHGSSFFTEPFVYS